MIQNEANLSQNEAILLENEAKRVDLGQNPKNHDPVI